MKSDLTVAVRAPMKMPRALIDSFVEQHQDWVKTQRQRLSDRAAARQAFTYSDGDCVPYRGGRFVLATGSGRNVCISGNELLFPPQANRPVALAEFLRGQARCLVSERLKHFAAAVGVVPAGVQITSAATRWGSCSGKNRLSFSYRVACLPDALLDYVVVHELAHIRQHNHSASFWAEVGAVLPDYGRRRAELRAFQSEIIL